MASYAATIKFRTVCENSVASRPSANTGSKTRKHVNTPENSEAVCELTSHTQLSSWESLLGMVINRQLPRTNHRHHRYVGGDRQMKCALLKLAYTVRISRSLWKKNRICLEYMRVSIAKWPK